MKGIDKVVLFTATLAFLVGLTTFGINPLLSIAAMIVSGSVLVSVGYVTEEKRSKEEKDNVQVHR